MKTPFVMTWRRAVWSEDGPPKTNTRAVLAALAEFMDAGGQGAYPSQELLARNTGLSKPTVRRRLDEALADGWICRERRGKTRANRGFIYHARLPDVVDIEEVAA